MINDIIKIVLAAEWSHPSKYSDLSTNKTLYLTIDCIHVGDQC